MSSLRVLGVGTICVLVTLFATTGCDSGDGAVLDFDGDGTPDAQDAFPADASENADTDGDGIGDNADRTDGAEGADNDNDNGSNGSGLLPPPNPLGGEPGAAVPSLTTFETAVFQTGRQVFERPFMFAEGLGPGQTGVRCAECHVRPVVGGAGDVRLFRFRAAVSGFDIPVQRSIPPLFGAGLLARVSDEEILSREELVDTNMDGVTGRANIDGDRVGRFGRKAQTATVESVVREMLIDQLGITSDPLVVRSASVSPKPRGLLTRLADALDSISFVSRAHAQIRPPPPGDEPAEDDAVLDPEIREADLRALVSYIDNLAAPLRGPIEAAAARGEAVFMRIGCATCHVPSLPTENGPAIHPYSDLLLHDMGLVLFDGITRGRATTTEYRTQPLWGLRHNSQFLHDGRAATIGAAISAHTGEGQTSRDAFAALGDGDRQDLLAFLESL